MNNFLETQTLKQLKASIKQYLEAKSDENEEEVRRSTREIRNHVYSLMRDEESNLLPDTERW